MGSFTLDEARELDALVAAPDDAVVDLTEMVRDLARVELDAELIVMAARACAVTNTLRRSAPVTILFDGARVELGEDTTVPGMGR